MTTVKKEKGISAEPFFFFFFFLLKQRIRKDGFFPDHRVKAVAGGGSSDSGPALAYLIGTPRFHHLLHQKRGCCSSFLRIVLMLGHRGS